MTRYVYLALALVLAVSVAAARLPTGTVARRQLQTDDEPSLPYGWWQALSVGTTPCILRHFPGLPDGYGASQVQCNTKVSPYSHEFLMRLVVPGGSLAGASTVSTGVRYNLRIFNTMRSYSSLNSARQITMGVASNSSTLFTVEKLNGAQGQVDLATESFLLRSPRGYCRLTGSGKNTLITCDQADVTKASSVKMAYNSFWGVSLVNTANQVACGGYQLALGLDNNHWVNCTTPTLVAQNYKSTFAVGLKVPGAAQLLSGASVTFKFYDTLYRYQLNSWVVSSKAPYNVTIENNEAYNPAQWLRVDAVGGMPGDIITRNTVVTLWSETSKLYCGMAPAPSVQVRCDKVQVASSDKRYQFRLSF